MANATKEKKTKAKGEKVRTVPGEPVEAKAAKLVKDSAAEQAAALTPEPPAEVPKKRGRGRPSKAVKAAEEQAAKAKMVEEAVAVIGPLWHVSMAVLVTRVTPDMPYTREEATAFVTALVPVLDKYVPGGALDEYAAEIGLAAVVAVQTLPRVLYIANKGKANGNEESSHADRGTDGRGKDDAGKGATGKNGARDSS